METVTVILTPPEAVLFKDFQEYHKAFTLMCQQGVFGVRSGSVTIHFDSQGAIQRIERKDDLYNARKA